MRATRPTVRAALPAAATAAALALLLAACSGGEDAAPEPGVSPTVSADPSPDPSASASASEGASAADPAQSPGPSSSVGGVVDGFPVDVIPVLPDATVNLTTVAPAGDLLEISLNGATATPADQVLAFYRDRLLPAGFAETPGAEGATFTRGGGAEVLRVSVVSSGGQQQFTVGGTIAPPAG